jgi:protein SCO1
MPALKNSKFVFVTLGVLLGVVLVFAASTLFRSPEVLHGSVIEPAAPAPEIVLQDQFGKDFRLSDQRGLLVFLFFGYTHCADVCPATVADYEAIFKLLGDRAPEARFVFITVDSQRDTPQVLAHYLGAHNPGFVGLTGSLEALQQVYDSYSIGVEIAPGGASPGYEVNHSSRVYVVNQQGLLVETFPFGLSREAMLDDILHWIE